MAKKRKGTVKIIEANYDAIKKESNRPACFDKKRPFCRRELCEEYYDECKTEQDVENTDLI